MELGKTELAFTKAMKLVSEAEAEWMLFRGEEQMIGFDDAEKFRRLSEIKRVLDTANVEWSLVRDADDKRSIDINKYNETELTLGVLLGSVDEAIHNVDFISGK